MKKVVKSLCLVGALLVAGLVPAQGNPRGNCIVSCSQGTFNTATGLECCQLFMALCRGVGWATWYNMQLSCTTEPGTGP